MNAKQYVTLALATLLGLVLVVGCGDGEGSGKKLVIFSQSNNAEPYRARQNELMRQLMAEHEDVELEIMDAQQDNQTQISQIETAIRRRPDLLIVAPNERGPLTSVMGEALEIGIPTIMLERDIREPHYTTYVRMDNYEIGRMAGQFIVDTLTSKYGEPRGKMVELRGLLGVEAEQNRYDGAHAVLDEHTDIEVVHEAVANWLQSDARQRMTEILRVQPEIDVVYAHNDPMAVGAYLAAEELDRADDIIFIGVDGLGGPNGGIKKVQEGVLDATFKYPLGVRKAVDVGLKMLRDTSFTPEKTYTLESEMITRQNADSMYEKYSF